MAVSNVLGVVSDGTCGATPLNSGLVNIGVVDMVRPGSASPYFFLSMETVWGVNGGCFDRYTIGIQEMRQSLVIMYLSMFEHNAPR